ncbi:MAG: hypothetical protein HQK58_00450 [Deltaproteobacteria bacterium]|nr:hypothetical protein [Deltaproteobacteria bacterium]
MKANEPWEVITLKPAEILIADDRRAGIANGIDAVWGDWVEGNNRVTDHGYHWGALWLDSGGFVQVCSNEIVLKDQDG